MAWGEEYYEQKEPVGNAAADIGYCCGSSSGHERGV